MSILKKKMIYLKCFVLQCILFCSIYVFKYTNACKSKVEKPTELPVKPEDPGNEVVFICELEGSVGHITQWIQRDNISLFTENEDSNLTVIYYENYTTVDFNCSDNNPIASRALILRNTIRLFKRNEYVTDSDNGSIACCLYFHDPEQTCKIRRNELKNKTMLVYQEMTVLDSYGSASYLYYYIGAAVVAVVVISIKVSLAVKECRIKENRISNNNTSVAKGPNIPLYADLDMPASPKSAEKIANEGSSYVQITSPDMVSYNQMDSQEHYENVQVTEVPYAQVMKKHR